MSSPPVGGPDDIVGDPGPCSLASRSARSSMARSSSRRSSPLSRQGSVDTNADEEGYSTDGDLDYDDVRRRNMEENNNLMAELGLSMAGSALFASQKSLETPPLTNGRRRNNRKVIRDRNGYILSRPPPGERYRMACVEISADRKTRRSIAEGAYSDRTSWEVGEERRWRFGDGDGVLAEGEEPGEVDGISDQFRWRDLYDFIDDEPITLEDSPSPTPVEREKKEKVPYNMLTGGTCHQCKRKSDKPKMQCRNPECGFLYCWTCCKRYSSFQFDEEARSWICPFCQGDCNCGACLSKTGRSHLIGSNFGTTGARAEAQRLGESVEDYLKRTAKREKAFDRVRLVDAATDIPCPPLPQVWLDYLDQSLESKKPKLARPVKRRKITEGDEGISGTGGKGKGKGRGKGKKRAESGGAESHTAAVENGTSEPPWGKKKRKTMDPDDGAPTKPAPIVLKFVLPQPYKRAKEVDSDGETVHGYSEDGSPPPRSDRSVSSSTHSEVHHVVQHAAPSTNEFLARLTAPGMDRTDSEMSINTSLTETHDSPLLVDPGPLGVHAGDLTLAEHAALPDQSLDKTLPLPFTPPRPVLGTPRTPLTPGVSLNSNVNLARLGLLPDIAAPDLLGTAYPTLAAEGGQQFNLDRTAIEQTASFERVEFEQTASLEYTESLISGPVTNRSNGSNTVPTSPPRGNDTPFASSQVNGLTLNVPMIHPYPQHFPKRKRPPPPIEHIVRHPKHRPIEEQQWT